MSKIAATTAGGDARGNWPLRVYFRNSAGNVTELCADVGAGGTEEEWYTGGFPQEPADHVAATSWKVGVKNQIRVYLSSKGQITEWVFGSSGWMQGNLRVPGHSVAVACWGSVPALRVYVSDGNNNVTEWCNDDGKASWFQGAFQCKGSELAAAAWEEGGSNRVRLYALNGSNVEEHCCDPGGWYIGNYALPKGLTPAAVGATHWSPGGFAGGHYVDVYVADVLGNINRQTTLGGSWNTDASFLGKGNFVATLVYDTGAWRKSVAYTIGALGTVTDWLSVDGSTWGGRGIPDKAEGAHD